MNESQERPLVTFALFAYNQEKFIREAVNAALSQEYARLEIIISDDCSTDSTFEIIKSIASEYSGFHEILINRNQINLGLARHFSEIVGRARGGIIVVAAGDDISLPQRVSKTVEILDSDPEALFVSFTDIVIDDNGKKREPFTALKIKDIQQTTLTEYLAGHPSSFSGASRGFKRKIFDVFGGLNDECPTEDTPYILRGLMLGHALISSECGILYRQHDSNLSGPASLHSMKFEEINKQYLCDAALARSSGLISEDSFIKINYWAEVNYKRRLLSSDLFKDPNKLRFFWKNIFPSKYYKLREKLRILKNIIN